MEETQDNGVLLYHEVQESKLCAVHCVNTLLQGPLFNEVDLATLARQLDSTERRLMIMDPSGVGLDSQESSNVSVDGNFSIQVLEKALSIWDLSVIPLDSPDAEQARKELQNEEGFICHLQDHWFSIRKVNGEWYNFNSLYPAPEHLSKFYLTLFLETLKREGWSIFLVRGNFPKSLMEGSNGFGQWLTPDDAKRILRSTAASNQHSEEAAIKVALAESLKDQGVTQPSSSAYEMADNDQDLKAAILASLMDSRPTDSEDCINPSDVCPEKAPEKGDHDTSNNSSPCEDNAASNARNLGNSDLTTGQERKEPANTEEVFPRPDSSM